MHCCDGDVHVPPNTRNMLIESLSCCALRSITDFFYKAPHRLLATSDWRNTTGAHFLGHVRLIYQATLAQGPHNRSWKTLRTVLLNKILQTTKRYFQPNHFPSLSLLQSGLQHTWWLLSLLQSSSPCPSQALPLHISHKLLLLSGHLLLGTLWSGKPKLEIWFCYHLFRISKYVFKGSIVQEFRKT